MNKINLTAITFLFIGLTNSANADCPQHQCWNWKTLSCKPCGDVSEAEKKFNHSLLQVIQGAAANLEEDFKKGDVNLEKIAKSTGEAAKKETAIAVIEALAEESSKPETK